MIPTKPIIWSIWAAWPRNGRAWYQNQPFGASGRLGPEMVETCWKLENKDLLLQREKQMFQMDGDA
jgi:hypothetical protein